MLDAMYDIACMLSEKARCLASWINLNSGSLDYISGSVKNSVPWQVKWLEFQDNTVCTHQQVGPRLEEVVGVEDSFVVSTQMWAYCFARRKAHCHGYLCPFSILTYGIKTSFIWNQLSSGRKRHRGNTVIYSLGLLNANFVYRITD